MYCNHLHCLSSVSFLAGPELKPCQTKKGRKFVSVAPKMVSFSLLLAVKKDAILGAAETIFWPFLKVSKSRKPFFEI